MTMGYIGYMYLYIDMYTNISIGYKWLSFARKYTIHGSYGLGCPDDRPR